MRRPRQPQPPHRAPFGFRSFPTPSRRSRWRPRAGSPTATALALGVLVAGSVSGPIVHIAHGAGAEPDATVASPAPGAAPLDIASPATVAATRAVRPVRITTHIEHRDAVIPAPVVHHDSAVLAVGATRIDAVGMPGTRHETVEVVRHDGEIVAETVTSTVDIPATPTIVAVGTATSEAATKDWDALAQCESGGDPTIVSRSGRYHGLYQFDLSTWRTVGGEGLPSQASPDEQTARAMALYDQRGAAPWPTCGRHL